MLMQLFEVDSYTAGKSRIGWIGSQPPADPGVDG